MELWNCRKRENLKYSSKPPVSVERKAPFKMIKMVCGILYLS